MRIVDSEEFAEFCPGGLRLLLYSFRQNILESVPRIIEISSTVKNFAEMLLVRESVRWVESVLKGSWMFDGPSGLVSGPTEAAFRYHSSTDISYYLDA